MTSKPARRPSDPRFSPGPTRKRPGWTAEKIAGSAGLGRSHRAPESIARMNYATRLIGEILGVPADYRIAIVPGSDTGAVEAAMWSMLGPRGVDVFAWDAFGKDWAIDAVEQLKFDDLRVFEADYGELPDMSAYRPERDVVFTWNGTTSGVRVPNDDWIAADREGLTICDATSAAFAMALPWEKLDVITYSFQKVMGGEAAHGVLIVSPRAIARLNDYQPSRPVPKLLRLAEGGKANLALYEGMTINTPSMWCIEDHIDALEWAQDIGGLPALIARADENSRLVYDWLEASDWARPQCLDVALRSATSACFTFKGDMPLEAKKALQARMLKLLAEEGVAYDISAYKTAPPGFRLWCGATVPADDLAAVTPWIDWAYEVCAAEAGVA